METDRKFTFGKHKGEFILEVIKKDRQYIKWCITNINWFKLNDVEQHCFDQTIKSQKRNTSLGDLSVINREFGQYIDEDRYNDNGDSIDDIFGTNPMALFY